MKRGEVCEVYLDLTAGAEIHKIRPCIVEIAAHVGRSLKRLRRERELIRRLDSKIRSLAEDPRPPGYKKLKSSQYENLNRVREGDWLILYAIEGERVLVLILDIVRRDKAYRSVQDNTSR
jgi:mRNA interferase RelE/StbE